MRNLLCVAAVLALTGAAIGTAYACGGKHHHHSSCGAPTCGAPTCGAPTCGGYGAPVHAGGCAGGGCGIAEVEATPATLVVNLPADARLLIDGTVTTSETARRVFETPALESGREYHYTLEAQVVRDGKTEVITLRTIVRAGEETEVRMELPTTVAAR